MLIIWLERECSVTIFDFVWIREKKIQVRVLVAVGGLFVCLQGKERSSERLTAKYSLTMKLLFF